MGQGYSKKEWGGVIYPGFKIVLCLAVHFKAEKILQASTETILEVIPFMGC